MSTAAATTQNGVTNQNSSELNNGFDAINPELEQQIAMLAYNLWIQRGQPIGSAEEDWIEAEQQLRNTRTMAAGAGR